MPLEDKAAARLVQREISKHSIESSMLNVQVINQICYIGGTVSKLQGQLGRGVDLKQELAKPYSPTTARWCKAFNTL